MDHNVAQLRHNGLKVTGPRLKILDLFERYPDQHMSAEDVYRLLLEHEIEIGVATIYRVLTHFEQAGILLRHHFETGSEIRLSLTRSRNRTELAVYNQGSPVPDYALAKIPQRFYSLPRADGSRSSGLGLSFTTEIMRLHHGRLMLANRENGVEALLLFEGKGEEAV